LGETGTGYEMVAICRDAINRVSTSIQSEKIAATNPEKATDNIRKKALQWGDTPFNPIDLELKFDAPRLIPASVIGEMKRKLVEKLTDSLIEAHQAHRSMRKDNSQLSTLNSQLLTDPDEIPDHLMTCHHCIRYANGLCSKETGQKAEPLFIRNGSHIFRLEFDCKNCLMYIQK